MAPCTRSRGFPVDVTDRVPHARGRRVPRAPIHGLVSAALALASLASPAHATGPTCLVPMDVSQTDHLRAYGLTWWVLDRGRHAEWLLNYRGGSFLFDDDPETRREAARRRVTLQVLSPEAEDSLRAEMSGGDRASVVLEKAPKVALYDSSAGEPLDRPIELALEYAGIAFSRLREAEILAGDLSKYDCLLVGHQDFTGQQGRLYAAYHSFSWYQREERVQRAMAAKLGYGKVSQLEGAVALAIRDYIDRGGYLFAMCSAAQTYDIALAAEGVDIADSVFDGDPRDREAYRKLDYTRTLAFKGFNVETNPLLYGVSDIDVTEDVKSRGPTTRVRLLRFPAASAREAAMLVQDHTGFIPEFLGACTGFRTSRIADGVTVLAEVDSTDGVKYLCGRVGNGGFAFLGGHDPEDYEVMIGDPDPDLSRHTDSPGYRLILNNILSRAAPRSR